MTREQVYLIVHHKNPYSLTGFEPGTSGFVVWTSDHRPASRQLNSGIKYEWYCRLISTTSMEVRVRCYSFVLSRTTRDLCLLFVFWREL
jgi:hypothetical protein